MSQILLALQGGAQVLFAAILLGAGLPVIFSLGMRALAFGSGGSAEIAADMKPHPVGKALAGLCFGVVVVSILVGIAWIVGTGMGYSLVFDHLLPTFRKK
jgi:TRAP-type mannitol/chloroaromatic compound transport system permease large subunit